MTNSRTVAVLVASVALAAAPLFAFAQSTPVSQVMITTQLASGVSAPVTTPVVTVTATQPSLYGTPNGQSSTLNFTSNFVNDTRTVTFVPGSYAVTASAPGNYMTYSTGCAGFTPLRGTVQSCVITLTNTPSASPTTCPAGMVWYGSSNSCGMPVTTYSGPLVQNQLTCSPSYQTVQAGRPATFYATGGTGGAGYNWTTADRTFLNVSPTLSTILQNSGTQTVVVSNGIQTASCVVNVSGIAGTMTGSGVTPAVISTFIPKLPNTGFEPHDAAAMTFAVVLLISAGIMAYPYVRRIVATL